MTVKVVGRRWIHIGEEGGSGCGVVVIDLGQDAAVRPQDTPAPTVTAAGVVKFRFSLAGDLAVPGTSAVCDELLLNAVRDFSALAAALAQPNPTGPGPAAAAADSGGVQVACRGCGAGLLQAGHGVTRFMPAASAALAEVAPYLTCSGGLSDYFAESGSSTPGACLVADTDLLLCDHDVDQARLTPQVGGGAGVVEDGDRVTVECARCKWVLGAAQYDRSKKGVLGLRVHQCAVDVVRDNHGGSGSAGCNAARGDGEATSTQSPPMQKTAADAEAARKDGGGGRGPQDRTRTGTFTACAARALLSATFTWSVQRLVVVAASAGAGAGAGAAPTRLCLWMAGPPIERVHGCIATSTRSSSSSSSSSGGGSGGGEGGGGLQERVQECGLQRSLKLFYTTLGADDAVPAGWEESATVRTLVWPTELVVVVMEHLLASTDTAAPGSRKGPADFHVGFLPL